MTKTYFTIVASDVENAIEIKGKKTRGKLMVFTMKGPEEDPEFGRHLVLYAKHAVSTLHDKN